MVPYTRGEEVSRPFEDVLVEVAQLAAQGVREVNLLGQNVNAYRGAIDGEREVADLGLLIRAIAADRRHRPHPLHHLASAGIFRLADRGHRDVPQLANYLHLPVQSGSDRILRAMKRNHTALEYKAEDPQAARGQARTSAISSDFIVGFPGETDADFEETMKLIEDVGFDQCFSFIYSRARARRPPICPTTLPKRSSSARLKRLQDARSTPTRSAISQAMIGSVQTRPGRKAEHPRPRTN